MLTSRQRARRTKLRYVGASLIPVAISWLTNLKVAGFQEVVAFTPTGQYETLFIVLTLAGACFNALGALHNKDCTDAMQTRTGEGKVAL